MPRRIWPLVLSLAACGGTDAGDDSSCTGDACACTPEAREVAGTALAYDEVFLTDTFNPCPELVLTSAADVTAAFPDGDAPPGIANADFAVDRVVLTVSNPAVDFVVDDGTALVVGAEPLCQGAAPSCVAYKVHGTTRNALRIEACPYTGPDPCLAP